MKRLGCLVLIGLLGGTVSVEAQQESLPGWTVHILDIQPGTAEAELTNLTQAEAYLAGESSGLPYSIQAEATRRLDVIDLAGEPGSYTVDHAYPDGVSGSAADQFVVWATADVFIPEGNWSVAFGSHQGGQVTIGGVLLDDSFFPRWGGHGPDGNGLDAPDRIRQEGPRDPAGYGFTGGHFRVGPGGLETTISAMMYNGTGPDGFEVVVRNNSDILYNERPQDNFGLDPSFDFLWQPLGDGVYDWQVHSPVFEPLVAVGGHGEVGQLALPSGSALLSDTPYELEVDVAAGASDRLGVVDGSGSLDVSGATFHVEIQGAPQEGTTYNLVRAGSIVGQPTFVFSNGAENWDTSQFASTGSVTYAPSAAFAAADFDRDGDVDAADMTDVILNWTGPLPPGQGTASTGDTDGDKDVDAVDFTDLILSWTGARAGYKGDRGNHSDLLYNPETGDVIIDPSDTENGMTVTFVLVNASGGFTPIADDKLQVFAVQQADNTANQIGITDLSLKGKPGPIELGPIFPPGMSVDELEEFLTTAKYAYALGKGGDLDLVVVPEPGALALLALGLAALVRSARRRKG